MKTKCRPEMHSGYSVALGASRVRSKPWTNIICVLQLNCEDKMAFVANYQALLSVVDFLFFVYLADKWV